MRLLLLKKFTVFLFFILFCYTAARAESPNPNLESYQDLVLLFKAWRAFEKPPLREGAPDYTEETFRNRLPRFKKLQERFTAIDTTGMTIAQQVDWHIVRAEMNGYDFNQRILRPWARDPAFYKSLWTY